MTVLVTASTTVNTSTPGAQLASRLAETLDGQMPTLVFVFAGTQQPLEVLLPPLIERFPNATVLSASTAGEFTERNISKGAAVAAAIAGDYQVRSGMGTELAADPERAVSQALEPIPDTVDGYPHRTAVMLLDPLSGNGEEATLLTAALMSNEKPVRLAGGAAGDDLAMRTTHVGMGTRVAANSIVIAAIFSKTPLGIGVCHGHAPLPLNPVTVTKAEGATVYELDGRPAWDVWKEKTRDVAAGEGVDVDAIPASEIGGFLLRYEAGLANGTQFKIRGPLSLGHDGAITFACGIPQGTVVRITESTAERQVASAVTAAERARAQLQSDPAGAIVFDCICRNLILGEKFGDAVAGVSKALGNTPLAGFETYGEIALDAGDMSGFHNTTTVVLAFPS